MRNCSIISAVRLKPGRVLRDVVPVDPHGLRQLVLLHGEMVIAVQLGIEAEQQRIREHPRL